VWVTNYSSNSVSRINPANNTVIGTVEVGNRPVGVAAGSGSIWSANSNANSVSRIDPATMTVTATITTSTPFMLAAGAGSIWVPNTTANTVSRIDPATNAVVASISTGTNTRPTGVTFDGTDLWVTYRATSLPTGQVARIDTATNTVTETIAVGAQPIGVLAALGSIWVANNAAGTVSRIDPATSTVVATIDVGGFSFHAFEFAYDGTNVWVSNSFSTANRVARIDPSTNTVTATVDVGARVYGILFDSGSIWAAVYGSNTVKRISP
jgi:YVTN family beta-propeller protein